MTTRKKIKNAISSLRRLTEEFPAVSPMIIQLEEEIKKYPPAEAVHQTGDQSAADDYLDRMHDQW